MGWRRSAYESAKLAPWWFVIPFPQDFLITMVQEMEYAQRLRRYDRGLLGWVYKRMLRKRLVKIKKLQINSYARLLDILKQLGLSNSAAQAARIVVELMEPENIEAEEYPEMLQALLDRIVDETQRHQFFMIAPHLASYYAEAPKYFGEEVNTAFPSTQPEIEHAAKCFALGRNTASVFHLMRVMEVGLHTLGASLNSPTIDFRKNPTWETVLGRCDDQLKVPYNQRSAEWRADDQFYSTATANLRAVKGWMEKSDHACR